MKFLGILFLFFASLGIAAQEKKQRIQTTTYLTNRLNTGIKMSVQEAITYKIKRLLDSLANKTKGNILLTSTVRFEIENILYPYWKSSELLGTHTSQAYFIQTGLQTMTQMDMNSGRLIVMVGLAISKPAEFVFHQYVQIIQNKKLVVD